MAAKKRKGHKSETRMGQIGRSSLRFFAAIHLRESDREVCRAATISPDNWLKWSNPVIRVLVAMGFKLQMHNRDKNDESLSDAEIQRL
jgi:hypothetical protein